MSFMKIYSLIEQLAEEANYEGTNGEALKELDFSELVCAIEEVENVILAVTHETKQLDNLFQ